MNHVTVLCPKGGTVNPVLNEMMVFQASFVHIVQAKLGQADAGDNEAKLMTKLAPEWVRTSDPVIRSPARYRWTTAPALNPVLKDISITKRKSPYMTGVHSLTWPWGKQDMVLEIMLLQATFVHITQAKLGQADAKDNEMKLMMKHAPEWVRTSDTSDQQFSTLNLWTTAPT